MKFKIGNECQPEVYHRRLNIHEDKIPAAMELLVRTSLDLSMALALDFGAVGHI